MTAPLLGPVIPHLRVTFGGSLGTPSVEIWSNTINFNNLAAAIPTEQEVALLPDAIAPAVATWFNAADSIINLDAKLEWLKAVWIQADNKQRGETTAIHDYPGGVPGGSNVPVIWEQSYCLTWRTPLTRGRGHAGRIYPPLSGPPPVAGSPDCTAANANRLATSAIALLAGMRDGISQVLTPARVLNPVVISRGNVAGDKIPRAITITGVVVDRVADIQHRRTNRVPRAEGNLAPATW